MGRRLDLRETVLQISPTPYEGPSRITPDSAVEEWRGTCSTKHVVLHALAAERWPEHPVTLWDRVYTVTRETAHERWGDGIGRGVPADGLVDVHMYATVAIDDSEVVVDATFPLEDWDGTSDTPWWCGPGEDFHAGQKAIGSKADLVGRVCDPALRAPFIAALIQLAT